jgi:TAT (twin-arginine translocation) pathway signal sequence
MDMSRRTVLKAATAAGAALAGLYGCASEARVATPRAVSRSSGAAASRSSRAAASPSSRAAASPSSRAVSPSSGAAASPSGAARVGATVTELAYTPATTWEQAMADFNTQVGRDFAVAKRYYRGANTWPTDSHLGPRVESLIERDCRGLLCFQPKVNGDDLAALTASLKAIKARLTNVKVTLWQEQGLSGGLSPAEFRQCYQRYQPIRSIFPLFVDFSGSHPSTWSAYNPGADLVDGFAVDYYASAFARGISIEPLAELANEAGKEFGIWEIGNCALAMDKPPSEDQIVDYFGYLTSLQGGRLKNGHLVGDMAWFNDPHNRIWTNTIAGISLAPGYQTARAQLDGFFDTFNGV